MSKLDTEALWNSLGRINDLVYEARVGDIVDLPVLVKIHAVLDDVQLIFGPFDKPFKRNN